MHRSKLDIGGAHAAAGGMSISSGSSGASGMGASSLSSDASVMAHSTWVFGSGLRLDLSREQRASGVQLVGLCNSLAKIVVAACAQLTPTPMLQTLFSSHRSVTARAAHSADDALFMAKPSNESSRTERARVALTCARMQLFTSCGKRPRRRAASTTCFVVGGCTARREGTSPAWRQECRRWRGCWPCPREGSTLVLLSSGSARCPMWP